MLNTRSSFHIKGLDGLRFIGSIVLLTHHVEKIKLFFGIPNVRGLLFDVGIGHVSMTLFFVLSGFLISYILLNEKIKTGTVVIKNFYIKRICRIWPIYYMVLILGITVFTYWVQIPDTLAGIKGDYYNVVLLYFFHLSNFQIFFASSLIPLLYYWSMGVEEQFYAFWPWIIKKTNNYVKVFIVIISVKVALKLLAAISYRILPLSLDQIVWMKRIEHFLFLLRFEAFAFGGIAAYFFLIKKDIVLNFVFKPWVQWLNIALLVVSMPVNNFTEIIHVFYAISFAILILNMAGNPNAVFSLNYRYTDYIGKISYGIYMFQVPVLIIILNILKPYYTAENSLVWNILVYFLAYTMVLMVSVISYELMEKRIMAWGNKKVQRLKQ